MHTIRLREPWDVEPAAGGLRRHRRFFNKPTGLDSGEQVRIVVDAAVGFVELTLNGSPPPHAGEQGTGDESVSRAYDVTTLLNLRNELVIVTTDLPASFRGEVRLEILLPRGAE
jgi:hypothetical protein